MITGIALVIGAVLAGWLLPVALRSVSSRVTPGVAIAGWVLACVGVVGTVVVGVGLVAWSGPAHHVLGACWDAVDSGVVRVVAVGVGVVGVGVVAVRVVWRRREVGVERERQLGLLRVVAGVDAVASSVVWLDCDEVVAYSVAGRVVVSRGLWERLPAEQVAAVLAHEHAHVRERHHVVIAVADVLARSVPLPIARALPTEIRALAERSADRAAVRRCGIDAVRGALTALSGSPDRVGLLGSGPNRALGVLLPAAMAVPAAVGVGLLGACLALLCPFVLA